MFQDNIMHFIRFYRSQFPRVDTRYKIILKLYNMGGDVAPSYAVQKSEIDLF